jgi:hypothetical protein
MSTGVYENQFGKVFSNILESSDVSCYKISQYTNLDEAYLSRLRNGLKDNPSPEVVIRIALALVHHGHKIRLSDIEKLFNATGRTLFPKSRGY